MPLITTTTNATTPGTITGTKGGDTLYGFAADEALNGLAGNDHLFGLAGNDTLEGGIGNDSLNGGLGNDVYLFGRGDGRDMAYMTDVRPMTEVNTLRLKPGVLPSDLSFDMSGTTMLINIIGTTDQFRVEGFLYGSNTTNSANPLQQIIFADGTTWNLAEIQARLYGGTEGADVRGGTYLGDTINGLAGADLLDGRAGNDTIDGGAGDDTVIGGLGNDVLLGGLGNDNLTGDDGNDTLDGGAGDDVLDGGAGNDVIDGGAGDDLLLGGAGNDSYLFGKGDGKDRLGGTTWGDPGQFDTLTFKAGVLIGDIAMTSNHDGHLIVRLKYSDDQITLHDFMADEGSPNMPALQQMTFADGTKWDKAAIRKTLFAGTDGSESIYGTLMADAITGLDGDDYLVGRDGADTLDGGAGKDNMDGGLGNDIMRGGSGNDYLNGAEGDDILDGGAGNDQLYGGTGNDTFDGGAGNDTLTGAMGKVRYLFGQGDGQDAIWGLQGVAPGRFGTLQFKEGILPSKIVVSPDSLYSDGVILKLSDTLDQVTINNFLDFYGEIPTYNPVQEIRFADGTIWSPAAVRARLYAGTNNNDRLFGTIGGELITGLAGDDTIEGGGGNDTIDGGLGNDMLYGDAGNDTYLFGKGDGQDQIREKNFAAPGEVNILQFKAGITAADLVLSRVMGAHFGYFDDLHIGFKDSTDGITARSFLYDDDIGNPFNPLQQIRFADGKIMDAAAILAKLMAPTEGNDTIMGTSGADLINGLGGADNFDGRAGNDTLDGGRGNDTVNGGADADIIRFGRGDGQDTVTDDSSTDLDVLEFKQGVLPGDVQLEASPDDRLVVKIKGSTDQVTVHQFMPYTDISTDVNTLQEIRFADGTSWNLANIEAQLYGGSAGADRVSGTANANTMFGLDGNDFLSGKAGNDTIDGGRGNDTIRGGGDSDTYLFGRGDGADTLESTDDGSTGKIDVLRFKAGIVPAHITLASDDDALIIKLDGGSERILVQDFHRWEDVNNQNNPLQEIHFANGAVWDVKKIESLLYAGTSGAEEISGTFREEFITGQAGDDTLAGLSGNDTLDGGAGNDIIIGGADSDTYLFGRGDGADTISSTSDWGSSKVNTLQFKAGIAGSDLQLSKSDTTLFIKIAGGTDQLTVYDFLSLTTTPNPANPLQQITFADGISWDLARINAELVADATPKMSASFTGMAAPEFDVGLVGVATPPVL
ncbi:calcium-binding protein [Massilia pseudoviolaceinigra]|uniref:calcium-binding protein n=1 Tax=Massilia pseudoviolaceinigra TaxID=3057165 RepID=UPI002796A1AF|nr:calcium-binding protein [Massilia sp. CCM 9206]MDQ1920015.1 calcium-binding protein [Massilia sp. CCM 9206]